MILLQIQLQEVDFMLPRYTRDVVQESRQCTRCLLLPQSSGSNANILHEGFTHLVLA